MWVADGEVVEEEHAVEGFGEELDLCLVGQLGLLLSAYAGVTHEDISSYQNSQSDIVRRV
jgi:hypothetical protein